MTYDPQKHNRRSIRLKGYDYASPGWYFLTLCLQNRECRFGEIKNTKVILNTAGRFVDKWWKKVPEKFTNSRLDVYQIMPNHFHGIVGITDPDSIENESKTVGADPDIGPDDRVDDSRGGHAGPPQRNSPQPSMNQSGTNQKNVGADPRISPENNEQLKPDFEPKPAAIPSIIQWFKTMTTNEYIKGVKNGQYAPFDRKLWQRNYYDHIIRDDQSLQRIRNYIINNPAQWDEDRNNPANI